jgi:exopolysaccharide production protein ExoZ
MWYRSTPGLPSSAQASEDPVLDASQDARGPVATAERPRPRKRLALVQFSRALVPLLVVTFHASGNASAYFSYDFLGLAAYPLSGGVNYFFTLTGFMVWYVYRDRLGRPGQLRPYLLHRFVRIYPLYWVLTLFWLAVVVGFPDTYAEGHETQAGTLLLSFLLLPSPSGADPILLVAWSLVHTVFFYAMFALLFLQRTRFWRGVIAVWLALSVVYALGLVPGEQVLVYVALSQYNLMFAAGVLCAYVVQRHPLPTPVAWPLLAVGVAGFPLTWANYTNEWVPVSFDLAIGLSSALLILALASIDLRKDIRVPRALDYLGNAAFSVYLSHLLFLDLLSEFFGATGLFDALGGATTTIVLIVLATIGGCLVHSYIEKPLSAFLRPRLSPASRPHR